MKTSEYPYYQPPFHQYNKAQAVAIPFLDKDVNMVVSFATAAGKCIDGSSRVLMADGHYETIQYLFDLGLEEYDVLSLNQSSLKIEAKRAKVVRLKHTGDLIRVGIQGGRVLSVTPEHPLLVKRSSKLEWIRTDKLRYGDYVVVPNMIRPINVTKEFNVEDILNLISHGCIVCPSLVKRLVTKVAGRQYGSEKTVASNLNINQVRLRNWKYGSAIPVVNLLNLSRLAGEGVDLIKKLEIRGSNNQVHFHIPLVMSNYLARFLGEIIADGRVSKNLVQFYNYCQELRDDFRKNADEVFGAVFVEFRDERVDRVVGVKFNSIPFVEMMSYWGIMPGKKSHIVRVPRCLFGQSREVIGSFLSGLIDCDGHISGKRSSIEYSTDSEELAFGIQTLLVRLGVAASKRKKFSKGKLRYRVLVEGVENFHKLHRLINLVVPEKRKRFLNICGRRIVHSNVDVVPYVKDDVQSMVRELGIKHKDMPSFIRGVISSNRNPGFFRLKRFLEEYKDRDCDSLSRMTAIVDSDFVFRKVEWTEKRRFDGYVYDMTVPVNQNFIAENIVVHNTVLAEGCFAYHLQTDTSRKVFYVCPFRSLASEKHDAWTKDAHFAKYNPVLSTGDTFSGPDVAEESRMIVTTSESFDSKTRSSAYVDILKDTACVVFDESHTMGIKGRGSAVEMSVSRLSRINPSARIIMLSATMGNAMQMAKWIKFLNGKETKCVVSSWRPTKLEITYHPVSDYAGKVNKAVELAKESQFFKTVVFVHSKATGSEIVKLLRSARIPSAFHNASLPKGKRKTIEKRFNERMSGLNILVSTSTLGAGVNIG